MLTEVQVTLVLKFTCCLNRSVCFVFGCGVSVPVQEEDTVRRPAWNTKCARDRRVPKVCPRLEISSASLMTDRPLRRKTKWWPLWSMMVRLKWLIIIYWVFHTIITSAVEGRLSSSTLNYTRLSLIRSKGLVVYC